MNRPIAAIFGTAALGAALLAGVPAQAQKYQATLTDLYDFTGGNDGSLPNAPLAPDTFHDLYGTTQSGVLSCSVVHGGCGAIFKLNGQGQLSVLYDFTGGNDGGAPFAGPILMRGKLYGTTYFGGAHLVGTIFSINADGTGFTTLHAFTGHDGQDLQYKLLPGLAGGLYGIAINGGPYIGLNHPGNGTVFLWEPKDTMLVLHDFTGGAVGGNPVSLLKDGAGNLFGSTVRGGSCSYNLRHGCGVVFEIEAKTRAFTVLYTFTGGADGTQPILGSIDASGTIYGAADTTSIGGGAGVLFSLTPSAAGYQFSAGPVIRGGYAHGYVTSGPQPGPGNGLVGTLNDALFADFAGHVATYVMEPNYSGTVQGPLTVAADGTIYGVNPYAPQFNQQNGAIFSFTITKATP